jgi:hypothetical protein
MVGGFNLPVWKIWWMMLGTFFPIYGNHVWNHQPGWSVMNRGLMLSKQFKGIMMNYDKP